MKKIFLILFLISTINCFGQEITKEYWNNLFDCCKDWTEDIEYSGNQEGHKLWFTIADSKGLYYEKTGKNIKYELVQSTLDVIFGYKIVGDHQPENGLYKYEGENYRAGIADHYILNGKYFIEYWCYDCFDYNLEIIKLKYLDKKR